MDRMLYLAMNGARQIELAQAVNTHNLANASTTGYRADSVSSFELALTGAIHNSRIYSVAESRGADFSPGPIKTTGRELDIAINGNGWIAVQGADGKEAYTRAGDLQVTEAGVMTTGAGHPVMGSGGIISIPSAQHTSIGQDGTVSVLPLGQAATSVSALDRIKLVNPPLESLVKGEDGLFRLKQSTGQASADESVRLISGSLESSNVNAIEAMVNMISLSRQFEMQIKAMRTAEETDQSAAGLLSE